MTFTNLNDNKMNKKLLSKASRNQRSTGQMIG